MTAETVKSDMLLDTKRLGDQNSRQNDSPRICAAGNESSVGGDGFTYCAGVSMVGDFIFFCFGTET